MSSESLVTSQDIMWFVPILLPISSSTPSKGISKWDIPLHQIQNMLPWICMCSSCFPLHWTSTNRFLFSSSCGHWKMSFYISLRFIFLSYPFDWGKEKKYEIYVGGICGIKPAATNLNYLSEKQRIMCFYSLISSTVFYLHQSILINHLQYRQHGDKS